MFIMRVDVVAGALATVTIFGRTAPRSEELQTLVAQTQSVIAMVLYFAGMALAVFASAGLVAAVFEPGRIELLLSKPISRTHLLLGRDVGNILVIAANILYLVVGSWIIFGLKTKIWGFGFVLSSLFTIFIFAVMLAVLVLAGVLWDSAAIAIMATFAIMIVTPILAQRATASVTAARFGMVAQRGPRALLRAAQNGGDQCHHPAHDSQRTDRELDARLEHRDLRRGSVDYRALVISQKDVLMLSKLPAIFLVAALAGAAPRVDNVLEKMVPADANSIVGGRMDAIKGTSLYQKLMAAQKLPQMDQFAQDTGFDPRRDVRELLFVTTPSRGRVLLARGTFHPNPEALRGVRKTRHGQYEIWGQDTEGFCILDSSLAVAGDIDGINDALDEWTSGAHTTGAKLLARVSGVSERAAIWGYSPGLPTFLVDNIPKTSTGIDFSRIFKGLEEVWFQADLSGGLLAEVRGATATDQDAISLRDAVRGLVGLGRLSGREKTPELLRLWDGISAEQVGPFPSSSQSRDIAEDLIERLVRMLGSTGPPPGPRSRV